MNCFQSMNGADSAYLRQLNHKVVARRIPLTGTLDLTWGCNLSCVHCYLGKQDGVRRGRAEEISCDRWLSIIDEIAAAGCLQLLMTGGEPFLHKNFLSVYRHAIRKGILVTIFSNGTAVSDRIIDCLVEYPPQTVEISLYGASAETYETITQVKGSYNRCLEGIQTLLDHHIRVKLKTVLMSLNAHEFAEIKGIAREFGIPFRFDAALFPGFDGNRAPVDYRVPAGLAVDLEMADPVRRQEWHHYHLRTNGVRLLDGDLYLCGAGRAAFYISPQGCLSPCLMIQGNGVDLACNPFPDAWCKLAGYFKGRRQPSAACRECDKIALCGYCPAFFELERGDAALPSPYLCEMGQHRMDAVCSLEPEGEGV